MTGPALGTVRNSSERFGTGSGSEARGGRLPFISDEALLEKARQLNHQLGRPPSGTELIENCGGCQKQRALRAIQQLRVELAQKVVRSLIVLPAGVREDLDHLAGRLLDRAAEQLAEKQATFELENERKLLAAREETEQLTHLIESLRARLADAEHMQQELLEAQSQMRREVEQATNRAERAEAVSEERQRLITDLLRGRTSEQVD